MPAVFFGHGNPMNALLRNPYTESWVSIGAGIPRPKTILCVSANSYIEDAAVTVSTAPKTIHDFGGFPRELCQVQYPAPGDPELALRVQKLLAPLPVRLDDRRGLDHCTWAVLCHVCPQGTFRSCSLASTRRSLRRSTTRGGSDRCKRPSCHFR
jgi:4,5-DOPA dioxygenase extradiol